MEINYKVIGVRVRKLRNARGLTQEELAEKCNLSTVYIGYVENAKKQISLQALTSIANALGVGTDDLLNYKTRHSEYSELLSDCTAIQKEIICLIAKAVKDILSENNL